MILPIEWNVYAIIILVAKIECPIFLQICAKFLISIPLFNSKAKQKHNTNKSE